jgi:hypothetical protein
MSARTWYKHQLYCVTEGAAVTSITEEENPADWSCPHDTAHEVNPYSYQRHIETLSDGVIYLSREKGFSTNGYIRVSSYGIDVAAGQTVVFNEAWPFNIAIYTVKFAVTVENVGCLVTVDIAPCTIVGVLTALPAAGDTVIHVSPTAADNVKPSFVVTLQPVGGAAVEVGLAASVDKNAGTITLTGPVAADLAAAAAAAAGGGAPTLVQMGARPCHNLEFALPGMVTFGDDRQTSMYMPVGRLIRTTVVNPTDHTCRIVAYVHHAV